MVDFVHIYPNHVACSLTRHRVVTRKSRVNYLGISTTATTSTTRYYIIQNRQLPSRQVGLLAQRAAPTLQLSTGRGVKGFNSLGYQLLLMVFRSDREAVLNSLGDFYLISFSPFIFFCSILCILNIFGIVTTAQCSHQLLCLFAYRASTNKLPTETSILRHPHGIIIKAMQVKNLEVSLQLS